RFPRCIRSPPRCGHEARDPSVPPGVGVAIPDADVARFCRLYGVEARSRTLSAAMPEEPRPSLVTLTHVIYALHAASLVTGVVGVATIVGAFLTACPSITPATLTYLNPTHPPPPSPH